MPSSIEPSMLGVTHGLLEDTGIVYKNIEESRGVEGSKSTRV